MPTSVKPDHEALCSGLQKTASINGKNYNYLPPEEQLPQIQQSLLHWFATRQRPLPWRKNYRPYEVWISEIMLQQTQMERGVSYFKRWMRRFPDVGSLARADEEEVLRLWEGLGYYARARNALAAARQIMERHGGVFPSEVDTLLTLPGIGPYTARAIASIAFGTMVACVDANVERVLARIFNIDSPVGQEPAKSLILDWAARLLPAGHAREHNQAVMELGALICGKKPLCPECPLQNYCTSYHLGLEKERPVRKKAAKIQSIHSVAGVLRHGQKVFVQKRPPTGIWSSLWEFPGGHIKAGEDARAAIVHSLRLQTGFSVCIAEEYGHIRHNYTTYRITQHCFGLELASLPSGNSPPLPALQQATDFLWVSPEQLHALAMPTAHRKLANRICRQAAIK